MSKEKKTFEPAMMVDRVVDTTAAGDFYAAGVMYGLMNDCSLEQCAQLGTLLSGNVIQIVGTQLTNEAWEKIRSIVNKIIAQ